MMLDAIFAITFYALIGVFLYLNRHKVQRELKVIFLVRTRRAVGFIKKWGEKLEIFWKIFGTIGVLLCVAGMLFITFLFIDNSFKMLSTPSEASKTYLVIPGVQMPGSPIFVPFIAGIISIIILAVIHEFSHGFVAAAERIRLKSVGWGLFLIFPLAFVEPDEEDMKNASRMARLRVFSAGSASNITVSVIFALILYQVITPAILPLVDFDGIQILTVTPESGADTAGLQPNHVITSINGQEALNMTRAVEILSGVAPAQTINVTANSTEYSLTMTADPDNTSRAIMGVTFTQHWSFKEQGLKTEALSFLQTLFFWLANLNLIVGIMNLLPIFIFDGGKILAETLGYKLGEKQVMKIVSGVSNLVMILLIFNLVGSYLT